MLAIDIVCDALEGSDQADDPGVARALVIVKKWLESLPPAVQSDDADEPESAPAERTYTLAEAEALLEEQKQLAALADQDARPRDEWTVVLMIHLPDGETDYEIVASSLYESEARALFKSRCEKCASNVSVGLMRGVEYVVVYRDGVERDDLK